jgi:hypothetical protein
VSWQCPAQTQKLEQEVELAHLPRVGGSSRSAHGSSKDTLSPCWETEDQKSACQEQVYLWTVCRWCFCGFSFLILPQISATSFWKIPAWLSCAGSRKGSSSLERHLVIRALRVTGEESRALGETRGSSLPLHSECKLQAALEGLVSVVCVQGRRLFPRG